ncbi:MAG: sugar ABC transporter ATP-binding protein [Pseudomonadota bacterium]|nr:sugar ABC transporter ATP-binding protein [Pseudomonadota bacterium]
MTTAHETNAAPAPELRFAGVSKAFAGVQALANVDLDVRAGEVHALLGENGAGKSTLMKILFGVYKHDSGDILIGGQLNAAVADPRDALAKGVALVAQEPAVVPQLDVAQNIFLGQRPALSFANRREQRAAARVILDRLAPSLKETARVGDLGMADRQVVEIARALARGGRIIAFDEPTSSLTPAERDGLFEIIRALKRAGKAIIYISHRMAEIQTISDRVTVLRDGRVVASGKTSDFTQSELNNLIAGRTLAEALARGHAGAGGEEALRVEALRNARLNGVSFQLRRGEIYGLAGLVGSGRTELVRCIFGADPRSDGAVFVDGKPAAIDSPRAAMRAGIALIPEDRRGQSLVQVMTVEQNFALANPAAFSRRGLIRGRARRLEIERYIEELGIRPPRADVLVRDLSGGNQQKVVIARWLRTGARVFLFDEPTRGIDVGAKSEIHDLLRRLAARGAAVLVISSELPELLALADRIGVMRDGRLVQEIADPTGLTEERLMRLASGELAS